MCIYFVLIKSMLSIFLFFQVTDIILAREYQTKLVEYLCSNSNANPGIDFSVTVLTSGFWPTYKSFNLSLPTEMVMSASIVKH